MKSQIEKVEILSSTLSIKRFSQPFIDIVNYQRKMNKANAPSKAYIPAFPNCVYFFLLKYTDIVLYNIFMQYCTIKRKI